MNRLTVSIITIVYNAEATLEQTILSVIGQTYPSIEYIIIDGGSKDGSLGIIKKFENQIATWISEPDKGISDAFNKGLKLATGDLIGIINADDWYELDAIETIVNSYNPTIDVYCGDLKLIDRHGNPFKTRKSAPNRLTLGMYIMHPTTFVTHNAYRKAGIFDINYKIAMDYDLMLRLKGLGFNFCYINKTIACMRATGVSTLNLRNVDREVLKVMKNHHSKVNLLIGYIFTKLNAVRMRMIKIN